VVSALIGWHGADAAPKYLMFYDFDPATQANWTNMGFTRDPNQIISGYTSYGFNQTLIIVDTFFFYFMPNNHLALAPTYQQNWDAAWTATIQNLAHSYGCIGVFLGDELLGQGLSVDALTTAANTVRATWPDGIIYWNEANKVILKGENFFGEPVNLPAIPSAVDWVSYDYYKLDQHAWTDPMRDYPIYLYSKMSANQKALVVPGSYGSNVNPHFSLQQYEQFMFQNAWAYYQWTLQDDRIIGINPWYYGPASSGQPGYEVSTYDMPIVMDMWQKIGHAIVSGDSIEF